MEGKLLVISAPSGAGKTTIARHLLSRFEELAFSVSATTRSKRPEEIDGVDYFFITPKEFRRRIEHGEFVEWEEVYRGCYYGTLRSEVERLWSSGKTVLFDVDVNGARSLRNKFGPSCLVIFVMPPSYEELKSRLKKRATELPDRLEERIRKAALELQAAPEFDRVIINDDVEKARHEAEMLTREFLLQKDS